ANYDAEIKSTDQNIGELLQLLQKENLMDHTIIVVTSDHGISAGENNRWFTEGDEVTPELTNVPLLIFVPRRGPRIYDAPVQSIDIAPTLLRLLSLREPSSFDGGFVFEPDTRRKILCEIPDSRWAIIHADGRYIYDRSGQET